ncbi:Uncharacterised protein [uncultured archaeon]|nr:Uncharacterised protein [uncultured archaeon]
MTAISKNVSSFLFSLPSSVKLLAAVKGRSAQEISEAAKAGALLVGENRIQEAKEHFSSPDFPSSVEKHFIGHLQSNKARDAVELFDVIETVDSVKLAEKISKIAGELGKKQRIYLEINIGGEESKFGFKPNEAELAFKEISKLPHMEIEGLMGMAPLGKEPRPYFRSLKKLAYSLQVPECSMGMTGDWKIAAEEGSTLIRIGTGIFGERKD